MSYQSYSVSLTEGQIANLARAYKNRSPITIRLKNDQLKGNFQLLITKTQKKKIQLIKQIKQELIKTLVKSKYLLKVKMGDFLARLHLL